METIICCYCDAEINDRGIKCSQCTDVNLCLECFACGVELGAHKKTHDYQVLVKETVVDIVLFNDTTWTVADEDLLLDAVEQHGFGNWLEVGNYMKLTKTPEDCERHFSDYFIDGNIGDATFTRETPLTNVDDTNLYAENGSGMEPADLTVEQQQELGFMSLRDDFEREYDNDAEVDICDVYLHHDDTPLDSAFKLVQVQAYRERLRERRRRKNVARKYNILHDATSIGFKTWKHDRKKQAREERDFHQKLRVVARFIPQSDYQRLYRNLQKVKRLEKHISTLQKFRTQGNTSLKGKLKMHAMQMNGLVNGNKKRKRRRRNFYK